MQEQPAFQILVTYDPATKQLQVQGAIQDKILAYGMLGLARDIIAGQAAPQSPLTVVRNPLPPRNGDGV